MIAIARIIEAWRDARIFTFPTEPRGEMWHLLKFPQFGLLMSSALLYFLVLSFGLDLSGLILWLILAGVILVDIFLAWLTFEWFLSFFRKQMKE